MTQYRALFFVLILSLLFLAACGDETSTSSRNSQTATLPAAATATADQPPTATDQPPAAVETATSPAEETTALPEATAVSAKEDTAIEVAPSAMPLPSPTAVDILAFTPAQQEGPYYPVEKPADHDNDLVQLAGAPTLAEGQILQFGGTIYDAQGYPLEGAVVEIWQTDAQGIYQHPGDAGTENRDRNFQFYGEAQTGPDGRYEFRTILPGLYEPRPRHIHVKVKLDGQEILTTQFYFAGEIDLQGADTFMLIDAQPGMDDAGTSILTAQRDLFININP